MYYYPETASEAERLGVSVKTGLSEGSIPQRRREHGENRLPEIQPRSILSMLIEALSDRTLMVLMGAAILSIAVEVIAAKLDPAKTAHFVEGVAILAAVAIASLVTTVNEARAQKQFRLLSKERADIPVKVLRDGRVRHVSIYELVVGDVVYLDTGDKVPADGLLLAGVDLSLDQSTLTGESVPADKGSEDRSVLGGTTVTRGNGSILVTAVGEKSEVGKLQMSLTEGEDEDTPLQERLAKLADRIGAFGLGSAILTFLALAISAFVRGEIPLAFDISVLTRLLEFSIVAVTIVVVAVPEGLPLAVTVSLAYSVRKMAREKNLVRKLASCETMGAATVICSDKTGTLTRNRMSVVAAWIGGKHFESTPKKDEVDALVARVIAEISSVNSTAFLEQHDGVESYVGNPTECALLAWSRGLGFEWQAMRGKAMVVRQLGFTSERKRMSTLVRENDDRLRLLVKGAPEVLVARATEIVDVAGVARALEDADRSDALATVQRFSSEGHRTLALAYRELAAPLKDGELEEKLVLLAVVAIDDPIRPEVAGAIAKCKRAGVEVKMVTGDNRETAVTIARQIGLLHDEHDLVLEGDRFRAMSDDELDAVLPKLRVLARSVPSDKLRLVMRLREAKHVVAVTGDGTNDAPALKAADVGFSMGLTGTEVAKEASDIVILDDNFASIVRALVWGRSIFENVRKFLQFQLTVNVVALTTAFLAAVLGFGIPLNTVQLLWVNLIMDTLAALALATEPPSRHLFSQPPHGRHEPLITRSMWTSILLTGAIMVAILFVAISTDLIIPATVQGAERLTFVFNAFVLMQVFNEVNARSTRFDRSVWHNLFASRLFLGVVGTTAIVQFLIIQFGGSFFKTVPLSFDLWIRSLLVGASMLVLGAVVRFVGRMMPRG